MSAFLVVLRVLTTIASFVLCFAPLPDFWRVHKTRSTGEVSLLPVVMLFADCYVWVMYAYQVSDIFPLFVMTILGMISCLGFGYIYYRWSKERVYIHQLCGGTGLFLAAYTLYYVLGTSGVTNQSEDGVEKTLGFICVAVNLALYASPLETMKRVIQTKNASSLPISISVVFLGNAVLWVAFAIADDDMFVLVPNAVGTALCLVQVMLFLIYRPKSQRGEVDSVGLAKDERPVADASSCEDVAIQMSPVYEALRSPVVGVKTADAILALSFINIAATISSVALCLSPYPDFRRIHVQQNTGEVRVLPVLMLCCNCFAWAVYGYLSGSYFPVLSINVFGTLSALAFTSVFYRWTKDRAALNKMGVYSAAGVLLAMTFVALAHSAVIPVSSSVLKAIVGYVAVAVNICLYASPLQTMKIVLRTKSTASLPITMCVVNLVNVALWVSYALLSNDMFILVPNAMGVALTIVQVALCIKYRPSSQPVRLGESLVHVKSEVSLSISPRPDVLAIDFVRSLVYEAAAHKHSIHYAWQGLPREWRIPA